MSNRILNRMRDKIRQRHYVMTLHADEETDDDGLTIFDVESAILNGTIIEIQRDSKSRERKYLVQGPTLDQTMIAVVAKFGRTGKLVILTVYVE